jgi:hypothetical protein
VECGKWEILTARGNETARGPELRYGLIGVTVSIFWREVVSTGGGRRVVGVLGSKPR